MQDETVTTHTDGYGIWHARVSFPSPGYGPQFLAGNIDRIRAKARRAIRKEILARVNAPIGSVRVEVFTTNLDSFNRMHSITYRERA